MNSSRRGGARSGRSDELETPLAYHEATKHRADRYAVGPERLDWSNQPDPFRRFEGSPVARLALTPEDDSPPFGSIHLPGAVQPVPVTHGSLSRFFECSLALSAWKVYKNSRWSLRINPSSGNLHPTEGYLIIGPDDPVIIGPAVYHYVPAEHALERRCVFPPATWGAMMSRFPAGSFLVGLSSIHWREAWKYGERAFRYCQHDVGHALGALRFAAAMLGWRLIVLESLSDAQVAGLLGLDREGDFARAEREEPDLLGVITPVGTAQEMPRGLPVESLSGIVGGEWTGQANRLSARHVRWDAIDDVAHATRKPATSPPPYREPDTPSSDAPTVSRSSGLSACRIIRQRRSATAFDGTTGMAAEAFYHMLGRLVPRDGGAHAPWDCFSWSPRIHLLMFVHRVESIPPGLYALVRDPEQTVRLRDVAKSGFSWTRPPGCPQDLPLYLLVERNCRRVATRLSLGQAIAGTSAFSLGMVGDFERSLREYGPWFYRRLFWEAGLIGQVLYLEAEAAGLRGTGIGAYFDDEVHGLFGLAGRHFQDLYHFTVGGPVEDPGLMTEPPYASRTP